MRDPVGPQPSTPTSPEAIAPGNARRRLDIVVLTDLRFPGGTSSSLADELRAAAAGGYAIGVLHLANPRLSRGAAVHPELRDLLDEGIAQLVLPGESVRARVAIVKHPMVFSTWIGGKLPIDVDMVIVNVGQVPDDRSGTYYDAVAVDQHITEALRVSPLWIPVSPMVRATLHGVSLAAQDWVEITDCAAWQPRSPAVTSPDDDPAADDPAVSDDRLVIGRHSRPDRLKWPSDPDQLRAAYPTDGSVRVRVLGGADAVGDILGDVPPAWDVIPFGAMAPAQFLADLDAFVYFHHPDLTEAFGRTILEALVARVLAVVPRHFEPLFGDACLYATPETAIDVVRAMIADSGAHRAQLDRASSIASQRFSHEAHRERLAKLIGPPATAVDAERAAPSLDLLPPGMRCSTTLTLVACLGAPQADVERLLQRLDEHRRRAPGFVPVVVVTIARPDLAVELGIETRVITSRRNWTNTDEAWHDYAQRRLRQLAAHYDVDNVAVADPIHPDAWIALQIRAQRDTDDITAG